jgi:hypothetical protein
MHLATSSAQRNSSVVLVSALPARVFAAFEDFWQKLMRDIADPYRPELHYMRGPGPKWWEKHGHTR